LGVHFAMCLESHADGVGAAACVAAAGTTGASAGVVAAAAAGLLSWASATEADPAKGRKAAQSIKTNRQFLLPNRLIHQTSK